MVAEATEAFDARLCSRFGQFVVSDACGGGSSNALQDGVAVVVLSNVPNYAVQVDIFREVAIHRIGRERSADALKNGVTVIELTYVTEYPIEANIPAPHHVPSRSLFERIGPHGRGGPICEVDVGRGRASEVEGTCADESQMIAVPDGYEVVALERLESESLYAIR